MTTRNSLVRVTPVVPLLSRLPAAKQAEVLERQLEEALRAAKRVLAESEALVAQAEAALAAFRNR